VQKTSLYAAELAGVIVEHQLERAFDGSEWRLQFVRHNREKLGLEPIELLLASRISENGNRAQWLLRVLGDHRRRITANDPLVLANDIAIQQRARSRIDEHHIALRIGHDHAFCQTGQHGLQPLSAEPLAGQKRADRSQLSKTGRERSPEQRAAY